MARNPFPPDDFDRLPDGSPKGVHRRVPRPWTRAVAFVLVVASSVGLAWGAAWVFLHADDISWLNWIRAPFEDEKPPVVTPNPSPSPSPSPSPTPSPTPTYDLELGAEIVIYNSSGLAGLAGEVRVFLTEETGFENLSADDWDGASPPANVIRYQSMDYESSAKYLASLLGIPLVSVGPTEGADIVIILVTEVSLGPEPSPSPSP